LFAKKERKQRKRTYFNRTYFCISNLITPKLYLKINDKILMIQNKILMIQNIETHI